MARNPFWRYTEDILRHSVVTVETESTTYEGVLNFINHNESSYLLHDVTSADGRSFDSLVVQEPITIGLATSTDSDGTAADRRVERVALAAIDPLPYSVRTFEGPDFAGFVRDLRAKGGLGNLPVVRPYPDSDGGDTYQVVSGHKRRAALAAAGIERHPVVVESLSDWATTQRFIDEHFPLPGDDPEFEDAFYGAEQMRASFALLLEDWPREQLVSHPAIEANLAMLDVDEAALADLREELQDATSTGEDEHEDPTVDSVAADLAEETDVEESTIREDIETLQDYELSLGAIKGALRQKYA